MGSSFLSDSTQLGKEFFAVNEPFMGGATFSGRKGTGSTAGKRTSRELPLDVSLAGAVSQ